MTVARAAQDEVATVRREMEERMKAAQETISQQVVYASMHSNETFHTHFPLSILVCMPQIVRIRVYTPHTALCVCVCLRVGENPSRAAPGASGRPSYQQNRTRNPQSQHGFLSEGRLLLCCASFHILSISLSRTFRHTAFFLLKLVKSHWEQFIFVAVTL